MDMNTAPRQPNQTSRRWAIRPFVPPLDVPPALAALPPAPQRRLYHGFQTREVHEALEKALNPNGFPTRRPGGGPPIDMPDPVTAAKERIDQGDLRPFGVYGFIAHPVVPGIHCPTAFINDNLPVCGGTFVSDIRRRSGDTGRTEQIPRDAMIAYNRTIASDPRFQELTGCRPENDREIAERTWQPECGFDPGLADSADILTKISLQGVDADFEAALSAYPKDTPGRRDDLTRMLRMVVRRGMPKRMRRIVEAGANPSGMLSDGTGIDNPLHGILLSNLEVEDKIEALGWLIEQGADFTNPTGETIDVLKAEILDAAIARGLPVNGYRGSIQGRRYGRPMNKMLTRLNTHQRLLGKIAFNETKRAAILLYAAGGRPDEADNGDFVNSNWWTMAPRTVASMSINLAYAHEKGECRKRAAEMRDVLERSRFRSEEHPEIMAMVERAMRQEPDTPLAETHAINLWPSN